jgi:hypothetical protein
MGVAPFPAFGQEIGGRGSGLFLGIQRPTENHGPPGLDFQTFHAMHKVVPARLAGGGGNLLSASHAWHRHGRTYWHLGHRASGFNGAGLGFFPIIPP